MSRKSDIVIGMDVGSTTVKAVVVDPQSHEILWHDYQRHHTKQPECVLDFLVRIGNEFPDVPLEKIRMFITGSGGGPLEDPTGAKFVQEVNAVTLAVETRHPDAGSVVELGGQDAKIIIFKENEQTGEKTASCSMNDKCASGTGATIDKCMIKAGIDPREAAKLDFDDGKLHHVAAKCGVFAETDIVNLVKTGIPANEIMCSLADAIVMQNLSVLTRGNTLRHQVILLGGPNTYLEFLKQCWRKRIPETWEQRGWEYPKDVPLEELILVPQNSELYAAYGAVIYGLHEDADVGRYAGIDGLKEYITNGRKARLGESAGPPLLRAEGELETFESLYGIAKFEPVKFEEGQVVRAVIGLDGGSTSSKAVLLDEEGRIFAKAYTLSKGNPIQDTKDLLRELRDGVHADGATLDIIGFGGTGYAADVLEECVRADVNIVETVAHMMSATHFFGDVDVICDIGGQDIKVLFMENGDIKSFKLSNQCSAGNGMLLQAMADQFGLPVTKYAETAFEAELAPKFSYGCAVFLDTDRVNFQKEGFSKEELLAGLAQVLPKNVWQYVVGVPRLAALGRKFVLQGGTQYNLAAVKAQVDYIKERVPDAEVFVHPHTGEAGAIGAAMETLRVVTRRGHSTFIGLDAAIELEYKSTNDETTVCHFCANHCSRTFIDAFRPDGSTSRYISGFSCEKGMVESKEAMQQLVKRAPRDHEAVPEPGGVRRPQGVPARQGTGADAGGGDVDRRAHSEEDLLGQARVHEADARLPTQLQGGGRASPQDAHRHASRAEHVQHGTVLAGVLRADRDRALAHPLQLALERRALRGGRQVRLGRPLLPGQGRAGTHPRDALPRAHARSEEAASTSSSSRSSRTCRTSWKTTMDTASCPIVAGTPGRDEGRVHEGEGLLRRSRTSSTWRRPSRSASRPA